MLIRFLAFILLINLISCTEDESWPNVYCKKTVFYSMFYYNDSFFILTNQAVYKYDKIRLKAKRDPHPVYVENQIEIKFQPNSPDQTAQDLFRNKEKFANHSGIFVYNENGNYYIYLVKENRTGTYEKEYLFGRPRFDNCTANATENCSSTRPKYLENSWGYQRGSAFLYAAYDSKAKLTITDYQLYDKQNRPSLTNLSSIASSKQLTYVGYYPFFNKYKNVDSAYRFVLDKRNYVTIQPVELDNLEAKIAFYDLILCKRHLCDPDFNLKGYAYFNEIKKYAFFVDNSYFLSNQSLIDQYKGMV